MRLTDFRINTSIFQKFERWTVNIINSKVKVKINDVAISKSLWLLGKIFWIYYI